MFSTACGSATAVDAVATACRLVDFSADGFLT